MHGAGGARWVGFQELGIPSTLHFHGWVSQALGPLTVAQLRPSTIGQEAGGSS